MEINKKYKLKNTNYNQEEYEKYQIVIGNTSLLDMNHYDLWEKRVNGKYKGVAPYTIDLDGVIYEHYDPRYYSEFLNLNSIDKHIIPITIENEGWLVKDYSNDELLTWCGEVYRRDGDTIKKKWRGKTIWAPYSDKQLDSLTSLCDKLMTDFKIDNFVSEHNTKIKDIEENRGIFYRSNYSLNYLDVSPAFDFDEFKNKLEK